MRRLLCILQVYVERAFLIPLYILFVTQFFSFGLVYLQFPAKEAVASCKHEPFAYKRTSTLPRFTVFFTEAYQSLKKVFELCTWSIVFFTICANSFGFACSPPTISGTDMWGHTFIRGGGCPPMVTICALMYACCSYSAHSKKVVEGLGYNMLLVLVDAKYIFLTKASKQVFSSYMSVATPFQATAVD